MPSSANLALSGITAAGSTTGATKEAAAADSGSNEALRVALGKLVRSKGFMWLAFSDKAAMYWSHAGEVMIGLNQSAYRILRKSIHGTDPLDQFSTARYLHNKNSCCQCRQRYIALERPRREQSIDVSFDFGALFVAEQSTFKNRSKGVPRVIFR